MDNLVQDLVTFMGALIAVECLVYVVGLWFVSYLSRKDDDDPNNFHS
jgi:hypothetical protein